MKLSIEYSLLRADGKRNRYAKSRWLSELKASSILCMCVRVCGCMFM